MKNRLLIRISDPERLRTLREEYGCFEMTLVSVGEDYYSVVPMKKKKKVDEKKRTDKSDSDGDSVDRERVQRSKRGERSSVRSE